MNKLISMTDFVLMQEKNCVPVEFHKTINPIFHYAHFLQTPLTIAMFVPCDESGNFLDREKIRLEAMEAMNNGANRDVVDSMQDVFWRAEKGVLFEGFIVCTRNETFDCVVNGNAHINIDFKGRTIESLVGHNFVLTSNAIKIINR